MEASSSSGSGKEGRLRVVGRQRLDGQAVRVGDHFGYGGGTHPALAGAHARAACDLSPSGE